jgi:hypothetical protein
MIGGAREEDERALFRGLPPGTETPLRMPFEAWPIPRKRIPRIVAVMGRCPHRLLTGSESFSMMQHEFAEDDLLREHPPLWSKRPLGCPHEPDHARNPQARNLEM